MNSELISSSESSSGSTFSSESWFSWIEQFCMNKGNDFFVEVDQCYIRDWFNLTGLQRKVTYFRESLGVMLDTYSNDERERDNRKEAAIRRESKQLYGLIHARYICTAEGIEKMKEKYEKGIFGCCPRVKCERQPVLPIGLYDEEKLENVKLYCPKCKDVYKCETPYSKEIDGAYFGTSFPHVFFMNCPDLRPLPSQTVLQRIQSNCSL